MGNTQQPIGSVMSEETSLAVLTTEIRHVGSAVARIEAAQSENVTKTAWEQRNKYVDDKIMALADAVEKKDKDKDKEFAAVWSEIKSRRVSWPAVGAFVVATIGLLLIIIPKFAI